MLLNGNDELQLNIESLKEFDRDDGSGGDTPIETANAIVEDDSFDTLDMSSISSIEEKDTIPESTDEEDQAVLQAESLYAKTIAMMKSGEIDTESAIKLLAKAAADGCSDSALYLGLFYSDPKNKNYNPTLAYDNYLLATRLGSANGCYKLGLCVSAGFGCEKNEALAFEIFNKGTECDHEDCIFAIGVCLEFGIG